MDVAEECFSYNVLEDLENSCVETWVGRSRVINKQYHTYSIEGESN
jgi:hypothetical protein